mmetsp:Transcript_55000/g.107575  ORF Transcript_55000/g.107575 Transcript_55000/m.107575 type:complete len:247 (-) Transcript_55000:331-1071(-)
MDGHTYVRQASAVYFPLTHTASVSFSKSSNERVGASAQRSRGHDMHRPLLNVLVTGHQPRGAIGKQRGHAKEFSSAECVPMRDAELQVSAPDSPLCSAMIGGPQTSDSRVDHLEISCPHLCHVHTCFVDVQSVCFSLCLVCEHSKPVGSVNGCHGSSILGRALCLCLCLRLRGRCPVGGCCLFRRGADRLRLLCRICHGLLLPLLVKSTVVLPREYPVERCQRDPDAVLDRQVEGTTLGRPPAVQL